jgi:toxin ParE1/3/4
VPAYKVSQAAFDDLVDIGAYTQKEWGISQRDSYLRDIETRFETLASNTEHSTVKDRSEIRKECFSSSINEHIIVFRKTKYGVRILRVLYKKMDFIRHL